MKTDKKDMNLNQMLADVEHAGRDARRREELGAMIDSLAAAEAGSSKHGFWWYSSRVAAAACILFFITTAVRIWFIPTDSHPTLVAEAEVPTLPAVTADSIQEAAPQAVPAIRINLRNQNNQRNQIVQSNHGNSTGQEEEIPEIEEYLAEEVTDRVKTEEAELFAEEVELFAEEVEPMPIDSIAAPVTGIAQAPQPSNPQPAPKKERRSFLSGLFHRDDYSRMDGTMLAFNLL